MHNIYCQCNFLIKGHEKSINSISIIDATLPDAKKDENKNVRLILTCSDDNFIHLWTIEGKKIGTFGSGETWNLRKINFNDTLNYNKKKKKESIKEIDEDNQYDIKIIEKENEKKIREIEEKLNNLISSKSTIENEKDVDDEKISTQ